MTWELSERERQDVLDKDLSLLTRACLWGVCSALLAFGLSQFGGDFALLASLFVVALVAGGLETRRRPGRLRAGLMALLVFVASLVALAGLIVSIVAAFGL